MLTLSILTDGLTRDREAMLDLVAGMGYRELELATGNWSDAPHIDLPSLLSSAAEREKLQEQIRRRDMRICALNCSGNQLAPGDLGKRHDTVVRDTFRLAELLGVEKIVMMSGLPGGGPNDEYANWVVSNWPEENQTILSYQWDLALAYWQKLVPLARSHGIQNIALENHGCQLVYNCETLFKLRDAVGKLVGMNLDPSHAFWMGADPIDMLVELGNAIHHLHAKDARLETRRAATNGLLDPKRIEQCSRRSWNFAAVGYGHDIGWWKRFFVTAVMSGYSGPVSLEIEDLTMDAESVLRHSTEVLKTALV